MIYFSILLSVITFLGIACSRDELLLEIEKLQADIRQMKQNLTDEVAALKSMVTEDRKCGSRKKRILLHSDADTASEINKLRDEVMQLRQGRGTVYVRWGKTECPQINGTTMIYKGYMAGKYFSESGSGTNSLCLPEDPTWGKFQSGSQGDYRGYVYGTEYEEHANVIFGKAVLDQDVPCAVCKVPGVSVMIPARVDFYPGWKLEYTGYLMANYHGYKAQEYTCIDADPDFVYRGSANANGHILYLVESICGALPCPPYVSYKELACAVCSI